MAAMCVCADHVEQQGQEMAIKTAIKTEAPASSSWKGKITPFGISNKQKYFGVGRCA